MRLPRSVRGADGAGRVHRLPSERLFAGTCLAFERSDPIEQGPVAGDGNGRTDRRFERAVQCRRSKGEGREGGLVRAPRRSDEKSEADGGPDQWKIIGHLFLLFAVATGGN